MAPPHREMQKALDSICSQYGKVDLTALSLRELIKIWDKGIRGMLMAVDPNVSWPFLGKTPTQETLGDFEKALQKLISSVEIERLDYIDKTTTPRRRRRELYISEHIQPVSLAYQDEMARRCILIDRAEVELINSFETRLSLISDLESVLVSPRTLTRKVKIDMVTGERVLEVYTKLIELDAAVQLAEAQMNTEFAGTCLIIETVLAARQKLRQEFDISNVKENEYHERLLEASKSVGTITFAFIAAVRKKLNENSV